MYHNPVLLDESVSALITDADGVYVDCTFGGGGHSSEILSRLGPEGRLIAFDRDADSIANYLSAQARADPSDERLLLIRSNFRFVHNFVLLEGYSDGVDGILADLGVSSHQFDTPERGFSFRFDAPLDMRMNVGASLSAKDVVSSYSEADLARVFRLWGEVPQSGKAASIIVRARAKEAIETTFQLNEILSPILPKMAEHKMLAQIYQALRIEVNGEMRDLEKFLSGAAAALKSGGRLAVITYHSLEDRMVKNFIRSGRIDGEVVRDVYGHTCAPLEPLGRKPIVPSEAEISTNTRARSAHLRLAVKV